MGGKKYHFARKGEGENREKSQKMKVKGAGCEVNTLKKTKSAGTKKGTDGYL